METFQPEQFSAGKVLSSGKDVFIGESVRLLLSIGVPPVRPITVGDTLNSVNLLAQLLSIPQRTFRGGQAVKYKPKKSWRGIRAAVSYTQLGMSLYFPVTRMSCKYQMCGKL